MNACDVCICYAIDDAASSQQTVGEVASSSDTPHSVSACGEVEKHVAYLGHDVGGDPNNGIRVSSLEQCCEYCNSNPECRYVTFNPPTCYLKTSDAGRAARPNGPQISATRTAPIPPTPSPYSGDLPNIVFLIVEVCQHVPHACLIIKRIAHMRARVIEHGWSHISRRQRRVHSQHPKSSKTRLVL